MSNIDDQLRAALRRREPPPGFADRVLERTKLEVPAPRPRRIWGALWAAGAIAAMLTLVSLSVTTYRHTREERAARQAQLALRIASEKLNLARDRVYKNAEHKDY
jgi:hypothetical protein